MNVTISNDTVIIGSYEYYYYDDCISYYNGYSSSMMMEHHNNNNYTQHVHVPPTLPPNPDNGRERFCRPPEKVTPLSDTKQLILCLLPIIPSLLSIASSIAILYYDL